MIVIMAVDEARERAMEATRGRILDVARDLLGRKPDASMAEVAAAAGVVRRTVYGYFPARGDLIRALATEAANEMAILLDGAIGAASAPDAIWARFVGELWPLAHRYRMLLELRRGDHGDEIHAVLRSVDGEIASVILQGQNDGVFGTHLPSETLARLASAIVFAIADESRGDRGLDARAAATTSLLMLGVSEQRVSDLVD